MRTSREETARNREKILKVAGKLFRERGLDGVSVSDIMASAGLTHGGFYRHFESKEALKAEACSKVAKATKDQWRRVQDTAAEDALSALIQRFLTCEHRDAPAAGCLYAALASEVGRSSDELLHQIFAEGLEPLLNIMAESGSEVSSEKRRQAAIGRMSALIGALILSRATKGNTLSEEILSGVRHWLAADHPHTGNSPS